VVAAQEITLAPVQKSREAAQTVIDLTEMEQRVLAELEEFWEQNVFTMLNTIIQPAGDAQEVAAFRIPIILSTASGRQKADEILRQRGYQWWRPKK
jgi:hypothetical protein